MIVLYRGAIGTGKTLSMTMDAYEYFCDGYRIISNFSLGFGESISSDEVLQLSKDSNIYDCVLVLDELQLFFDNRNFRNNIAFSNFIQQLRKRNVIILGTTQYTNTIELRFRQHISHLAIPNYNANLELCSVEYFDLTMLENINLNNNSIIPSVEVVFNAKDVFPLYDTFEMLK